MTRTRSQASRYAVAKGKDYERRIARILSEWWGSTLHRTPTSGVNIYSGDIVDDKGQFPFIVECKKEEDWSFGNLLEETQNKKTLWGFWKQSLDSWLETDPHHKEDDPRLVVFSKRSVKDYFMVKLQDILDIGQFCGTWTAQAIQVGPPWMGAERVMVGRLKDFFEWSDSEMLKTIPRFRRKG